MVRVENGQLLDDGIACVENAIKEADQDARALLRTEDFLEGKISFGVDEDHGSLGRAIGLPQFSGYDVCEERSGPIPDF